MLHTWEARRFEGLLKGGRTKPLLIDCERVDGTRSYRERFVVKAIGLPEVHDYSICNEVFGSTVAAWCGIKVAPIAVIDIAREFVEVNADAFQDCGVTIQPGLAAGSVFLPGLAPMPRHPALRAEDLPTAAAIYALDMAIQNPDRRSVNPNCGYEDGSLVAFDFESAFSFRFGILNPHPWAVTRFNFRGDHVFFPALRDAARIDWTPFMRKFREVNRERLLTLCGTMPGGWAPSAQPILDHLVTLGEHADDFQGELGRSVL